MTPLSSRRSNRSRKPTDEVLKYQAPELDKCDSTRATACSATKSIDEYQTDDNEYEEEEKSSAMSTISPA